MKVNWNCNNIVMPAAATNHVKLNTRTVYVDWIKEINVARWIVTTVRHLRRRTTPAIEIASSSADVAIVRAVLVVSGMSVSIVVIIVVKIPSEKKKERNTTALNPKNWIDVLSANAEIMKSRTLEEMTEVVEVIAATEILMIMNDVV